MKQEISRRHWYRLQISQKKVFLSNVRFKLSRILENNLNSVALKVDLFAIYTTSSLTTSIVKKFKGLTCLSLEDKGGGV